MLTVEAVVRQYSTLEVLSRRNSYGLKSVQMVEILASSPKLVSFITLLEDDYGDNKWLNDEETHFMAEDFVDVNTASTIAGDSDPTPPSFRPWACESTLRIFRAKISGIPRLDITQTLSGQTLQDGMILQEACVGQSHEIQGRVYGRLARLNQLEQLKLGT